jgi:hypothetical protein
MRLIPILGILSIPLVIILGNLLKKDWLSDAEIQTAHKLLIYYNIIVLLQAWNILRSQKLYQDKFEWIMALIVFIIGFFVIGIYTLTKEINGEKNHLLIFTGIHMFTLVFLLGRILVRHVK